jgi:chemotaxis protein histidine kinase CheA
MDKYLLEILKEVNTIIIPGLGALTITNVKTGEIMFMPYLKHDDGNLAKFIAEKEGIELNDAKNIIAKYVREIEGKLNVGETYDMFRFGSFFKNDSGDVEFQSWHTQSAGAEMEKRNDDATELNEQTSTSSPQKTEEPKKTKQDSTTEISKQEEIKKPSSDLKSEQQETKQAEEKKDTSFDLSKDKETKATVKEAKETNEKVANDSSFKTKEEPDAKKPKEEEKQKTLDPVHKVEKESKQKPIEKEPIPEVIASKTTQEKKTKVEPEPVKKTPVTTEASIKKKEEKKPVPISPLPESKKRGVLFYSMVAVFVVLIGGALTVALFYNSLEPYLPFVSKVDSDSTKVEMKKDDSAADDTPEIKDEEPLSTPEENTTTINEKKQPVQNTTYEEKPVKERATPANTGSGNYCLIVGSFKVQANADRFSSGISNSSVIECQNTYYVIMGKYGSTAEAKGHLGEVPGKLKPWIFQVPC